MEHQEKSIARVLAAIDAMRSGGMVIMVDDEDRENEGDLVFAAEFATADKINFMAKEARGLICLPLSPEIVKSLKLPLMDDITKGPGDHTTAFTVSIEARYGVTTGISAADRAHTIRVAAMEGAKPEDLVVPGHISLFVHARAASLNGRVTRRARLTWRDLQDIEPRRLFVKS